MRALLGWHKLVIIIGARSNYNITINKFNKF